MSLPAWSSKAVEVGQEALCSHRLQWRQSNSEGWPEACRAHDSDFLALSKQLRYRPIYSTPDPPLALVFLHTSVSEQNCFWSYRAATHNAYNWIFQMAGASCNVLKRRQLLNYVPKGKWSSILRDRKTPQLELESAVNIHLLDCAVPLNNIHRWPVDWRLLLFQSASDFEKFAAGPNSVLITENVGFQNPMTYIWIPDLGYLHIKPFLLQRGDSHLQSAVKHLKHSRA